MNGIGLLCCGVLMLGLAGTVAAETLTLNSAINKAGRQRMLSQRIAKISMFRAWGIATPQMAQDLDAAIQEFAAAQAFLVSAPQNTAAIGSELQLAGTQWLFFEEAVRQPAAGRAEQLRNIATTSERILQVMDNVTGLYAGIVK